MTPEEAARSYTYCPPAEDRPPFDDRAAWVYEAEPDAYAHDALGRRLAVGFAMAAALAIGFGIGLGLS